MPGYVGGAYNSSGIKWISSAPQNPINYNLPRAAGIIILNDADTLMPIAIMDGTLISAMRTGAVSGVVAKHLARKDSKVLGLVGAGVQNRTQLLAIHSVFPELEKVKVADLNLERARTFCEEMSQFVSTPFEIVSDAERAVRDSDIFVTATVTEKPIIKAEWISEGSLHIHVGSHECEFEVIDKADKVVVDDWEELKHRGVESISIMYAQGKFDPESIHAELGEIVNGKKSGRESDKEKIYFNSVGMGIEDVAIGKIIFERAKELKKGKLLNFWKSPIFI
jgi:N-[(2S)-2-amino-2-carboxyethyl]-L-glutamate dehydrogenase